MSRCSICRFAINPTDPVTVCPQCAAAYHTVCWEGIGGCATYGCSAAAQAEKVTQSTAVERGWGDAKECPSCGRTIAASLLVCTCGARFPWSEPMTSDEYREWLVAQETQARRRKLFVALFIISLFGVTAPVAGLFAGALAFRHREDMVGENGSFLALGYGTAGLGLAYAGLFVAFACGL